MTNQDGCSFSAEGLDLEQAREAAEDFHTAFHAADGEANALWRNTSTLIEAMVDLAQQLREGDVLGKRGETMRLVQQKLVAIAISAEMAMPGLFEQAARSHVDAAFDDIVEGINLEAPDNE